METFITVTFQAALFMTCMWAIFRRIVVQEGFVGLLYRNGRFVGEARPGARLCLRLLTRCEFIDMRRRVTIIPGQDVLTSDNVGIRISAATIYEITKPARAIHEVQDYASALYAHIQLALREVIAGMSVDQLLGNRSEIGHQVQVIAASAAEELGLKVHMVEIRDIMFPAEFRRAFASIVSARQHGQASIERARAESAVLRNLANSARLLHGNPALMNLRILQSTEGASSSTLVLGVQSGLLPVHAGDTGSGKRPDGSDKEGGQR